MSFTRASTLRSPDLSTSEIHRCGFPREPRPPRGGCRPRGRRTLPGGPLGRSRPVPRTVHGRVVTLLGVGGCRVAAWWAVGDRLRWVAWPRPLRVPGHPRALAGRPAHAGRSRPRTTRREAHLSAKQPETGQKPRISPPDVHPSRPCHHPGPAPAGPPPPVGLTGGEPVAWRIRDRATFEALRRAGTRARRGPVTVTYAAVGTAPVPRVAYAVGRRTGNAVIRNRLRRRLRAAVGTAGAGPRGLPGGDRSPGRPDGATRS